MKKTIILAIAMTILFGCNKSEEKINLSGCIEEMVKRYEKELKCTKPGEMETNLYRGIYKNQIVYFPDTMCPACSTVPPQYGYDCSGKKITFESFQEVSEIKQIYNSCTKQVTE